jgi:hypothetical protein
MDDTHEDRATFAAGLVLILSPTGPMPSCQTLTFALAAAGTSGA